MKWRDFDTLEARTVTPEGIFLFAEIRVVGIDEQSAVASLEQVATELVVGSSQAALPTSQTPLTRIEFLLGHNLPRHLDRVEVAAEIVLASRQVDGERGLLAAAHDVGL
mgnify:CR=1 FL=1